MTDMMMNMLISMLEEYWPFMGATSLFTAIISYASKKFRIVTSFIITFISFFWSFMLGVVGGLAILIIGFIIFPAIVWIGFFLGRYFRRKSIAKSA